MIGTPGAAFHPDFHVPPSSTIVSKGMGESEDAYSAFQARDDLGTPRKTLRKRRAIGHLYVGGLATDHCVKSSVLDALQNGFRVTLVPDAMWAVNLQPTDGEPALAAMRNAGAHSSD